MLFMATGKNVSLRDVASKAGVSPMTASRALSGRVKVSEAKRQAVLDAAKQLGYQVSPLVRSVMSEMRRQKVNTFSGTLAFLNTSNDESSWHRLSYNRAYLEGAHKQAKAAGFILDEIWIGGSDWNPATTRRVLVSRGIRGILIPPGGTKQQMGFDFSGFAVAAFGGLPFDLSAHQVMPDYFHNYAMCFDELWKLGFRRIGLFTPEYDLTSSGQEVVGGFLAAQWRKPRKYHIPVGHDSANWQAAESNFLRWLDRHRPDAIVVNYGPALHWLEKRGIQVPGEVGIAHPGLAQDVDGWSGIDIQRQLQGAHAVDLLTAQILRNESGLPAQPKRVIIGGKWVNGKTTRPWSAVA